MLRRDGRVWTTDKDGIAAALLAAEITAPTGRDPGALYRELCTELGAFFADRIDAPASKAQKLALARLSATQIARTELAGEPIISVIEDIYKIDAGSFRDDGHLRGLLAEAQRIVDAAIAPKERS